MSKENTNTSSFFKRSGSCMALPPSYVVGNPKCELGLRCSRLIAVFTRNADSVFGNAWLDYCDKFLARE